VTISASDVTVPIGHTDRFFIGGRCGALIVGAIIPWNAPMGLIAMKLAPLQNQMQWNVVNRLVEDARARGAGRDRVDQ
jgi:hypothetical protein